MKSLAMSLLIAAAVIVPGSLAAQAVSTLRVDPSKIEGSVWMTRAIVFPATTAAYQGTALFRADGTLGGVPRDGSGSSATPGVWIRLGYQDYAFTFAADTYDASGHFVSTSVVTGVMHVSDNGLSGSGTTLIEILDTAGNVLFKQPAATPTPFTATRIVAGTLPVQ